MTKKVVRCAITGLQHLVALQGCDAVVYNECNAVAQRATMDPQQQK